MLAAEHVHVSTAGFCIPKINSAETYFRSAFLKLDFNNAVRFLLRWLSSTAGYVPGNEAHYRSNERLRSCLAVPFQTVLFVFIRITQKSFSTLFQASLSASMQGVITTTFRFSLFSKRASPLILPILVSVKSP